MLCKHLWETVSRAPTPGSFPEAFGQPGAMGEQPEDQPRVSSSPVGGPALRLGWVMADSPPKILVWPRLPSPGRPPSGRVHMVELGQLRGLVSPLQVRSNVPGSAFPCAELPRPRGPSLVRFGPAAGGGGGPCKRGTFVSPQLRPGPAGGWRGAGGILPSPGAWAPLPRSPEMTVARRYLKVSFVTFATLSSGSARPLLPGKQGEE